MRILRIPLTPKNGKQISVLILVFFVVALISPNLLVLRSAADILEVSYSENIAYAVCFWALIFAVLPRIWMALPVAAVCSLWWPLEIFLRLNFDQPITPNFVGMAMDTNAREVSEFLSTSGWILLFPFALFLTVAFLLGRRLYRWQTRWMHRSPFWVLAVVPGALLLLTLSHMEISDVGVAPEPFINRAGSLSAVFAAVYPIDLPLSAIWVRRDAEAIRKIREKLNSFDFESKLSVGSLNTVVLVT